MSERNHGVTLIELLIAIALMIILTGSLSFVFVTARNVFTRSEATIQVYQNVRNAFDAIERELTIAVKTHDMEFFSEPDPETANGHYDLSEECFGLNVHIPDKDPKDPSKKPQEYVYAMTIYGREYRNPRDSARRPYRSDSLYFKTMTTIGGKTRAALVLYRLDIKDPAKPILKKYVLYRGEETETLYVQDPQDGSGQDLCLYVKEMKIEYYFDNVLDARRPGFFEVPPEREKVFCYMGAGAVGPDHTFSVKAFRGSANDNFGQLAAGDKILLFGGATPWEKENNTDYIIDTITGNGRLAFSKAGSTPVEDTPNLSFRAGYLPPALRFTLKIMDTKGTQVRTLTRIIKIYSQ